MTNRPHSEIIDAVAKEPTSARRTEGSPLVSIQSAIFDDVQVALKTSLGETEMSVADLLALKAGSVVKLALKLDDLVELRLNETLVARGEIVAVGDNFGVRLVEIAKLT